MQPTELAMRLAAAGEQERAALMAKYAASSGPALAQSLTTLFDEAKDGDLAQASGAAAALTELAEATGDAEIAARASWIAGKAALKIEGRADLAISHLDRATSQFTALGQPLRAASTQVSKLHALAMLSRYDEALECGLKARELCLARGDTLTAGKIEGNLGNIYFRRDCYREAEEFYRAARERFAAAEDRKQLTLIDTCLAVALIYQHKFRDAARIYEQALPLAEAAGLEATQAVIERNLGCLALFQGRYDRALDFLERSRRRCAALGMPHESAAAEQEMADAYLELNLAREAAAIYSRVTPAFAALGMRAEQARALAYHGRACLMLDRLDEARALLAEAGALYAAERNAVGEAMALLAEAQIHYAKGDYDAAAEAAARAEAPLAEAGTWARSLLARWLRGEIARAQGRHHEAESLLHTTLHDAEHHETPQVAQRCLTSLGLLAAASGQTKEAEAAFRRAVELIEGIRAPLPGEEFRVAFVADKAAPYAELVRLCLAGGQARAAEAFAFAERARSRALADMLGGALPFRPKAQDSFEAELVARLEELGEELNWFYSQINRPPARESAQLASSMAELHAAVREREASVLEITRQLQQRGGAATSRVEPVEMAELMRDLGRDSAFVEYFSLDGELLAFVVTDEGVTAVRGLGREEQAEAALQQLQFQIGALRGGASRMRAHLPQLTMRMRHYLSALYDLLLRPIEGLLGERRLVVAPYRALHYVPFHALHDGDGYVIERREVCYAPSASVLRHCLARPVRPWHRALLVGVPDAQIPWVRDEVIALAPLFPEAVTLLDDRARLESLREAAPTADVLHLACHGQFRSDSPLFSSLRLADGWLTVRDAYSLELNCGLVVLSACETGVSALAPGDELIGLARGFFSAGAPSLLVSLWTVDDESTAALMKTFYGRLRAGDAPAAALRAAQCELLKHQPHPFFWSPFVLLGRW